MQFGPGHQIQRRLKGSELKSGSNIHEQGCALDLLLKQLSFLNSLYGLFPVVVVATVLALVGVPFTLC